MRKPIKWEWHTNGLIVRHPGDMRNCQPSKPHTAWRGSPHSQVALVTSYCLKSASMLFRLPKKMQSISLKQQNKLHRKKPVTAKEISNNRLLLKWVFLFQMDGRIFRDVRADYPACAHCLPMNCFNPKFGIFNSYNLINAEKTIPSKIMKSESHRSCN